MTADIYPLPCPVQGKLWIMPCPSAGAAFDQLAALGITHVLSLLPDEEAAMLGMGQELDLCAAQGIGFVQYPIVDFGLPDVDDFRKLIARIVVLLQAGESLAVHCRAGIGRSGMVAACTLVALGLGPNQARLAVSAARGINIPDTVEQTEFITTFSVS